jgi:hypothetical protein
MSIFPEMIESHFSSFLNIRQSLILNKNKSEESQIPSYRQVRLVYIYKINNKYTQFTTKEQAQLIYM